MSIDVVWAEFSNDIVIKDLTLDYLEEALRFIELYYVPNSIVLRYLDIPGDEEATATYMKIIKSIILQGISLMILNKKTNDILGVAILQVMHYDDMPWTRYLLMADCKKIKSLLNMQKYIAMMSVQYKIMEGLSKDCLNIYVMCVKPEAKGHRWKIKLLHCAYKVAQSMFLPFISYIASTFNDQIRASYYGMEEVTRMYYGNYTDPDGTHPFKTIEGGEYYVVLFESPVEPSIRYTDIII